MKSKIDENRLKKLNDLANIIINEKPTRDFYLENEELLSYITPYEVFEIDFFKTKESNHQEIKLVAGKFVNLFRTGLLNYRWNKNSSLITKLLDEANKIREVFGEIKTHIKAEDYQLILAKLDFLDELKKRFHKVENVLFSLIESRITNTKPLEIIWELHDDAIILHQDLINAIKNKTEVTTLNKMIGKYFFLVLGILEKEELFILPIFSDVLKQAEFIKVETEMDSYGYSFLSDAIKEDIKYSKTNDEYLFNSDNGKLSLEELLAILGLVGDITFVDKYDKVKFFNTPHGHFKRTGSIIGRDVRNCHPQKSLHIVEEIIEKFKAGKEDRVDFWINFKGILLLISYFALRNKNNEYLGVIELTQDITNYKNISGEKRILDFNRGGKDV